MAELARMIENDVPSDALDVIVEINPVFHLREKIREELFALDERLLADFCAAELQQIECTQLGWRRSTC